MGNKYASFVSLNKEWSSIAIDGSPTFNEIVYLLSSLMHYASPVQQGATAAYKWTFVSNTSAADVGKTFTIEQGDADRAWRVAGARVSGLTFDFGRNEVRVSGNGVGEQLETGGTAHNMLMIQVEPQTLPLLDAAPGRTLLRAPLFHPQKNACQRT